MARAPDGFGSRWQAVRGLRLHALESAGGRGVPVVLLPGLVTASRSMIPLARALAGRGMRVRIVDPPGFGYSDKPRRALSTGEQAMLLAEWLIATGGQPARVLGNSFGSQLVAAIAAGYPAALDRVVLLRPTLDPAVRRRLSWLRALPGPAGAGSEPAGALHGRDAPLLAQLPGLFEPAVDGLAGGLERLPVPVVQSVYRRSGWANAVTARQLPKVRSERLADWTGGSRPAPTGPARRRNGVSPSRWPGTSP